MVKEPHPGRVKTRLGRDIGMVQAAWWFRHQTRRLIGRLSRDPRWKTVLCVSPDAEGLKSRVWPYDLPRMAQGSGDLGDRMARAFKFCAIGPTVIIGADIPEISRDDIWAAFRALGESDAVLGPAPDGGYWLIGLKRTGYGVPPGVFKEVRWSGPHAMADTVKSLGSLRIATLRSLRDVDTKDDLKAG